MAFSKKCQRYFNKRNHKIGRLLDKTFHGYDQEDYHDLRLEIKKVRSLMAVLGYLTEIKEKKYMKPYKRIFKMAGQVRDAQMAAALLKEQRPLKWLQQYMHELETETLLHEKKFFLSVNERSKQDLRESGKKVAPYLAEVKKKGVKKYLDAEKKKVSRIIRSRRLSIEDAHEMRKQLKAIGYTTKLLAIKARNESARLEQIQEALGVWHDHRQLAERLKKDAAGVKDKQRRTHMHNLEKTLNKKAAGMFVDIGKSLKEMNAVAWKSPAKGEALLL